MKENRKFGLRATATLGASALLFSAGASAADKELLDMLLKNGAINNQQYDQLIKKESLSSKDVKDSGGKEGHGGNGVVHLGDKGLEFESTDGNFKAAIGGRLQVDSQVNWNSRTLASPAAGSTATTNELADGMSLRRARMHLEGTFYKNFDYKFEYDFTRGSGTTAGGVTDAYIQWTALKPFALTVGQFKEPFSMEEATSNRYVTFIERNMAVNAFSDNPNAYRLGIGAAFSEPRWMAAGAVMSEPVGGSQLTAGCGTTPCNITNNNGTTLYADSSINSNGNANRNNGSGNTSWDVTGRVAGRPWYNSETEFLHVGASGSYRSINNNYQAGGALNNGGFLFASAIGSNVDRTAVLNTGNLTTAKAAASPFQLDHFTRFGAESAVVYGPFSMQGEYIRTGLSGGGYNDEVLEGYYGYASYFLTGESRQYKAKTAAWDRIKPSRNFDMAGGWGAWEVAAGYDYLNLNDGPVHGGRAQTAKLGLNWYPNSHVRLMANYVHVLNVDMPGLAAAGTTVLNNPSARQQAFNNTNPDMLEFRAQLDF